MNEALFRQNPRLGELSERLVQARLRGELLLQAGDEGWCSAPSNIALLKYWGKKAGLQQIPVNSSLSLTLGAFRAYTRITARGRFLPLMDGQVPSSIERPHFSLYLNGHDALMPSKMEVFLKSVLHGYADDIALSVESLNNFPTACGVASSAAGYAALVGAVADLLNIKRFLSESELQFWLTEWARLGSGSATRSAVPVHSSETSQYVAWELAADGKSSITTEVSAHSRFANMQHCVLVLDAAEKTVGSSEGHLLAQTSVLQDIRLAQYPQRIVDFRSALVSGDFRTVRQLSELDAFEMHAVMLSGATRLEYMNRKTARAIAQFISLRDAHSAHMFWTLDAGANPHFLFLPDAAPFMAEFFESLLHIDDFQDAIVLAGQTAGRAIEVGKTDSMQAALKNSNSCSELKKMSLSVAVRSFLEGVQDAPR